MQIIGRLRIEIAPGAKLEEAVNLARMVADSVGIVVIFDFNARECWCHPGENTNNALKRYREE